MAKVLLATSLGPGKEYTHKLLASTLAAMCGYSDLLVALDDVECPAPLMSLAMVPPRYFTIMPLGPAPEGISIHGRLARMRDASREFFLAGDWTHLYWHDADMVPPVDIIPRLLARELPIVNGFYLVRGRVDVPTLAMVTRPPRPADVPPPTVPEVDLVEVGDNGILECVGYGHGCMLVHREVMERTPYRDWAAGWYKEEGPGEDVQWCMDTRRGVWVDTTLPVWHVDSDGNGIRPTLEAAA